MRSKEGEVKFPLNTYGLPDRYLPGSQLQITVNEQCAVTHVELLPPPIRANGDEEKDSDNDDVAEPSNVKFSDILTRARSEETTRALYSVARAALKAIMGSMIRLVEKEKTD